MLYTAEQVASYVIFYCNQNEKQVTNLKLQKILYYLWIYFYKETGNYLFEDNIRAWQYGPVVPDVYFKYCSSGWFSIIANPKNELDDETAKIANSVLKDLLDKSARDLVDLSHKEGKPWKLIYKNGEGKNKIIPFSLIIDLECN